jgi:hypothetical protein
MRRFIAVSLLIIALPLMASVNSNQSAVYAGHISAGGAFCTCDQPGCIPDYPGECDGHNTNQQGQSPKGRTVEFSIVIVALMLWLRIRA